MPHGTLRVQSYVVHDPSSPVVQQSPDYERSQETEDCSILWRQHYRTDGERANHPEGDEQPVRFHTGSLFADLYVSPRTISVAATDGGFKLTVLQRKYQQNSHPADNEHRDTDTTCERPLFYRGSLPVRSDRVTHR